MKLVFLLCDPLVADPSGFAYSDESNKDNKKEAYPCLLAFSIGFEIVNALVTVVVISVETLHRSFRRCFAWAAAKRNAQNRKM